MSIASSSIDPVPYETGFPKNDPYGLEDKGKRLSKVFEGVNDPLVIAVDGPWGSGKSFFLKGWSRDHGLEAQVIYFDAFKHDYLDDPLVSLVQAISERLEDLPKETRSRLLSGVKKALPLVTRMGVRMLSFGAVQEVNEFVEIAVEEAASEAQSVLDKMWQVETSRHKAMKAFSDALEALVAHEETPPKLIFIVDELDRCRPDYALQLLEVMKHFFAVPNVHFVLGANVDQLQHSVRARYGAGIAADKYLQRFIHVTMDIRYNRSRRRLDGNVAEKHYFDALDTSQEFRLTSSMLALIPKDEAITFRDMERLYTLCRTTNASGKTDIQTILLTGLLILKACRPNWITQIQLGSVDPDPVEKFLAIPRQLEASQNGRSLIWDYIGEIWAAALWPEHIDTLPTNLQTDFQHKRYGGRYPLLSDLITMHLDGFEVL